MKANTKNKVIKPSPTWLQNIMIAVLLTLAGFMVYSFINVAIQSIRD